MMSLKHRIWQLFQLNIHETIAFLNAASSLFNGRSLAEFLEAGADAVPNEHLESGSGAVKRNALLLVAKLLPDPRPEEPPTPSELPDRLVDFGFDLARDAVTVERTADAFVDAVLDSAARSPGSAADDESDACGHLALVQVVRFASLGRLVEAIERSGLFRHGDFLAPVSERRLTAVSAVAERLGAERLQRAFTAANVLRLRAANVLSLSAANLYRLHGLESVLERELPAWTGVRDVVDGYPDADALRDVENLLEFDRILDSAFVKRKRKKTEKGEEGETEERPSYSCLAELRSGTVHVGLRNVVSRLVEGRNEPALALVRDALTGRAEQLRRGDAWPDACRFRSLVRSVVSCLDVVHSRDRKCPCLCLGKRHHSRLLTAGAELLGCLRAMNETWLYPSDLGRPSATAGLLPPSKFRSDYLTGAFEREREMDLVAGSVGRAVAWRKLLRQCPTVVSYPSRLQALNDQLAEMKRIRPTLTLSFEREQLFEQFLAMAEETTSYEFREEWSVLYARERGEGFGLTKEFFSLVSNGFRRHEMGMWHGVPVAIGSRRQAEEGEGRRRGGGGGGEGEAREVGGKSERKREEEMDIEEGTEEEEASRPKQYTYSANGLFPTTERFETVDLFKCLGQLMAKALLEGCLIDLPLSVEFFRLVVPSEYYRPLARFRDAARVFPEAAKVVERLLEVSARKSTIEDNPGLTPEEKSALVDSLEFDDGCSFEQLSLDFIVPGSWEELAPGGRDLALTAANVDDYLAGMLENMEQRAVAVERFKAGFRDILPQVALEAFLPEELVLLFCGEEQGVGGEPWTVKGLRRHCRFNPAGFDETSPTALYVLEAMASFDADERRLFLQFVTGSPRLPAGGLAALDPPLTVSRAYDGEMTADVSLPTSATCFNVLTVPEYGSAEVARRKLVLAMTEGSGSLQMR